MIAMFPEIIDTPDRLEHIDKLLSKNVLDGITLGKSKSQTKAQFKAISNAVWATPEGQQFDYDRISCPTVLAEEPPRGHKHGAKGYTVVEELQNPEFVVKPEGMLVLSIDCSKISKKHLQTLLGTQHQIHRLELIDADIDTLIELDPATSTLTQIHTLVLKDSKGNEDKDTLEMEKVDQLAQKFPRIACFDIRESKLDENPDALIENHIVLYCEYEQRHASVQLSFAPVSHNNILEQLNKFNSYMADLVGHANDKTDKGKLNPGKLLQLAQALSSSGYLNGRFHCFDFCVTKFPFLRGTEVHSDQLKPILCSLRHSFQSVQILDFGNCKLLDCDIFSIYAKLPLKTSIFMDVQPFLAADTH